jgi:cytochrome c553
MMKALFCLTFGIGTALAQTTQIESCASCHGPHGEGNPQMGAPRLAGQPQPYLERQLEAYATGRRYNEVMVPIARALTAADRAQLAAIYAHLDAPPTRRSAASGATRGSPRARKLAMEGDESRQVQACENCHGPGGSGFGGVVPYLAGQDARYLETALQEWKQGRRDTDPTGIMPQIAKRLTDPDITALAAYYASVPPQASQKTRPGAATTPREGTGVGGAEPRSGASQGPGGASPR